MNTKFIRYLALILFVISNFCNAKNIDLDSLGKDIIKYNREGKQKLSLQKLSDLLLSEDLTKEETAGILFYMASTYRGVNDYVACLDYLKKSNALAKDLPKDNVFRMKLDFEYAFVYFDNKEYEKSNEIMKLIAAKHYANVIPEDQSYLLLQEGYIFLINKELDKAGKKYEESYLIMKKVNPCNLPIVMMKMMELYSQKKNIKKVESLYQESLMLSKSCGVLKYQIFTAAEMEKVYKENDLLEKALKIGMKLDSLRQLEGLDNKVSEMHAIDRKYLEKQESLQNKSIFWEKMGATIIAFILFCVIGFSFFKTKRLKIKNIKMKEEIEQMKEDLDSYSQNSHLDEKFVKPELSITNSDKLTERQRELLNLMAEGLSNKEIADKLFIVESTVKYHIKNIYSILDIKDRKDFFKKMHNN